MLNKGKITDDEYYSLFDYAGDYVKPQFSKALTQVVDKGQIPELYIKGTLSGNYYSVTVTNTRNNQQSSPFNFRKDAYNVIIKK